MQLQKLEIQQIEEDHRKQVAAAALHKTELMIKNHHQMGLVQAKRASSLLKDVHSRARNLFKIGSIRQRREHGRCCN